MNMTPLTRREVFAQSWPVMLANGAAPIVGIVDTFIIGRFNTTLALAGMGLGTVVYAIAYWGFGFLRMSTAGLSAQAHGADNPLAMQTHLFRAVPLGIFLGGGMLVTQNAWLPAIFNLYTAASEIETTAMLYLKARLWGLPATLGSLALMGWFIGIRRAVFALYMQLALNLINLILSPLFVLVFGWGLSGVGWASAIAEWSGLGVGLWLARQHIVYTHGLQVLLFRRQNLFSTAGLRQLGTANSNIFIRTLTLTFGFNFFTNAAASQGSVFLAVTHIHMQFITLAALVLDGFAHTAEAAVGSAYGARDKRATACAEFDRAVRLTSEQAAIFAILCGIIILIAGHTFVSLLSHDPQVIATAQHFMPFCASAPILGVIAYQLDGIFIGTTQTHSMRNAALMALFIYLVLHYLLSSFLDAYGLWLAFLGYYLARGATLAIYYPSIRRSLKLAQTI